MTAELIARASFRLAASDLPPPQRLERFQELFDQKVQLSFQLQAGRPLDAEMTVQGYPGLRRAVMRSGSDVRLQRRRSMLADGEDDVCLIVNTGRGLTIRQGRQQSTAQAGDGVLLVYREAALLDFKSMNYTALRVPFAALAPFTKDIESAAAGCVRGEMPALRLLQSYVASLPPLPADPRLTQLIANHVHDLMALVIGATADGAEQARQRGVRAARLQVIRQELALDGDLTLAEIARRQGVSPRYVQMLFEESGTTFTEFVLTLRLQSAHRMLSSPRFSSWSVTAIALEAGFGDLSYFNRRFRQRFDGTPSDIRAAASWQDVTTARSPGSARNSPASR